MDSDIVGSERVCPSLVVCCDPAALPGTSFVTPMESVNSLPQHSQKRQTADLTTPVLAFLPLTRKQFGQLLIAWKYSAFCLLLRGITRRTRAAGLLGV